MGPPPIPKGTPHPMTFAIKPAVIPPGYIWAQGKVRVRDSKASKYQQRVNDRSAEKTLRRPHLGKQVYAYSHIRTEQVVYSLTRNLEDKKIRPQLLFHGKKTVPPSIRKDSWIPYFSIEFPSTKHGLIAYRQLRELSALRQLNPPESLIRNTVTSNYLFRPGSFYDPNDERKAPRIGDVMPRVRRAKILMNQRASSVADVAFVLGLQEEVKAKDSPLTQLSGDEDAKISRRERKRIGRRAAYVNHLKKQREDLFEAVQHQDEPLSTKIMLQAAEQLSLDAQGNVLVSGTLETVSSEGQANDHGIRMFWSDLRDAAYAAKWPSTVFHGELDPRSVHIVGEQRNRVAEAEQESVRKDRQKEEAARLDAEERRTKVSNVSESNTLLIQDAPELSSMKKIEPPPRSLGTRISDAVMFWRK